MIRTLINLDLSSEKLVTERTVIVGDIFPIVLCLEHGGVEDGPVRFDTLILEVFFNDSDDAIVLVDPTDQPVAGPAVREFSGSVDFYRHRLSMMEAPELQSPERLTFDTVGSASPLTLSGNFSREPAGPYMGRTGRAGIYRETPFELQVGRDPIGVLAGKAKAGLQANRAGRTRLLAAGLAFLDGEQIPIHARSSVLTIQAS